MSKCDRCGYEFGDLSNQWASHAFAADCIQYLKDEAERLQADINTVASTAQSETDQLRQEVERLKRELVTAHNAIISDVNQGRDLAKCRRLLRGLLLASECFMSSEVVDETSGTIPLMDRLSRAIDAAREGGGRG